MVRTGKVVNVYWAISLIVCHFPCGIRKPVSTYAFFNIVKEITMQNLHFACYFLEEYIIFQVKIVYILVSYNIMILVGSQFFYIVD